MRRFLLVLFLVAAALFGPSMPQASACSCASYDVRERLAEVDGAFVGALVARHDPLGGTFSSADQVRYTFKVEQGVKGDIPARTIDVWSASSGASCGLETPVGERAGLLLERDGDRWTSNLCSQADPDVLIRAGRPLPAPDGRAPPAVLVGTTYGPGRMLSLDGSGRVIAYGTGSGNVTDFAFCPGAELVAEAFTSPGEHTAYNPGVAIRSAAGLTVAWERFVTTDGQYADVADVACRAGKDAPEVLAIVVREIHSKTAIRREAALLAFLQSGEPSTLWTGDATGGTFSPDARTAWLTAGPDGRDLLEVDLADPGRAVVSTLAEVPAGLGPLALAPGGRHLAAATSHRSWTGAGSPPPTTAVVIDLAASPPKVTEAPLGEYGRYHRALWAGPDRIVFPPTWNDPPVRLFDTTLAAQGSWPGWSASHAAVVGDDLVGLNGPKVMTAPVSTGPATPWADLESGVPGAIAAVPDGAPIGEGGPTTTTTARPAPEPGAPQPHESGEQAIAALPGEARGMGGRPFLAGGAGAAVLGAAAAGLIRRRRLPKLPPL